MWTPDLSSSVARGVALVRSRIVLASLAIAACGLAAGCTSTSGSAGAAASPAVASAAGGSGGQASMGGGESGEAASPTAELPSSGVCGFTEPVTYGEVGADGFVDVPPKDPNIFYLGRIDCQQAEGPAFAFPGVSIRLRFSGEGLDLRLRDGGQGTEQSTNYYDVSIDGAEPTRLAVAGGDGVYALARDLGPGEHTAEVVKRVESNGNTGRGQVLGLRLPVGAELLPVRQRPLRVEFVGDSITCGYGNEVSTTTPSEFPYTTINQNANAAYGAVAARALDADYVAVAISGRGVYRNYEDGPGAHAPDFYETILPGEPGARAWEFARYRPHVVVVNLGTNDFSPPGPDHDAYRRAYAGLLRQIRGHNPNALLLAVVGTMLNDGFPPGVRAWTTNQEDVSSVVQELNAEGDAGVHYLALTPQSSPYGEDFHPTLATHAQMAESVATAIARLLALGT